MSWLREVFATEKPVIAMCHLDALPGDPSYDAERGLARVLENAQANLRALQKGGVELYGRQPLMNFGRLK
jgi:predicted TIM-barrel enzyme